MENTEQIVSELIRKIDKNLIEEIVKKLEIKMESFGYLDHQIRAIEELFIEQKREERKRFISDMKNKSSEDVKRVLTEGATTYFRIYKKPMKSMNKPIGYTNVFLNGFELFYADDISISEIEKRLIIAHELGHILLHYKMDSRLKESSSSLNNELLEIQAYYFAKLVLLNKSDFFGNNKKMLKYVHKEDVILNKIKNVFPAYDENKL